MLFLLQQAARERRLLFGPRRRRGRGRGAAAATAGGGGQEAEEWEELRRVVRTFH